MSSGEVLWNILLMLFCYGYILIVIFISSRLDPFFHVSLKTSRKFLHMMIGNLPFVIPFFTLGIFPFLVAFPFVLVTFCVSPYSPFSDVRNRLSGLASLTEEGHQLGLVLYAISYSVLALVFAFKPYVIAAGILPMAYGDAAASLVGERFGKRRYKVLADKSLEGSAAMFLASFFSVAAGLAFFSLLVSFSFFGFIFAVLVVAAVATLIEAISPLGFDNLVVPAPCALVFLALIGGV